MSPYAADTSPSGARPAALALLLLCLSPWRAEGGSLQFLFSPYVFEAPEPHTHPVAREIGRLARKATAPLHYSSDAKKLAQARKALELIDRGDLEAATALLRDLPVPDEILTHRKEITECGLQLLQRARSLIDRAESCARTDPTEASRICEFLGIMIHCCTDGTAERPEVSKVVSRTRILEKRLVVQSALAGLSAAIDTVVTLEAPGSKASEDAIRDALRDVECASSALWESECHTYGNHLTESIRQFNGAWTGYRYFCPGPGRDRSAALAQVLSYHGALADAVIQHYGPLLGGDDRFALKTAALEESWGLRYDPATRKVARVRARSGTRKNDSPQEAFQDLNIPQGDD